MCLGITAGATFPLTAPAAAVVIVAGFAFSRLWHWRTDPAEHEARFDRRAAHDTVALRWGEICAGALLLAQLAAYALDRDDVAAAFAGTLVITVIGTLRIDRQHIA